MSIDHKANGKQWRASSSVGWLVFLLRKCSVPLWISVRNPLLHWWKPWSHQNSCSVIPHAAWFQLKHWISKTITPILMWFCYVYPVYFDGKYAGGALANCYGKLAPVVNQCFQSQNHWNICALLVSFEEEFIPKHFQTAITSDHVRQSDRLGCFCSWSILPVS